ncbi:MAG: Hsp33 family molecular chaperone HslO, partial [Akkermansia sp.]
RSARAFALAGDTFTLLTAEPDADEAWLASLTAEDVAALADHEETKQLETRRFRFHCGCSVDRLLPTVRSLRSNFEDLLAEQGYILANCPRCGASFRITREMLAE